MMPLMVSSAAETVYLTDYSYFRSITRRSGLVFELCAERHTSAAKYLIPGNFVYAHNVHGHAQKYRIEQVRRDKSNIVVSGRDWATSYLHSIVCIKNVTTATTGGFCEITARRLDKGIYDLISAEVENLGDAGITLSQPPTRLQQYVADTMAIRARYDVLGALVESLISSGCGGRTDREFSTLTTWPTRLNIRLAHPGYGVLNSDVMLQPDVGRSHEADLFAERIGNIRWEYISRKLAPNTCIAAGARQAGDTILSPEKRPMKIVYSDGMKPAAAIRQEIFCDASEWYSESSIELAAQLALFGARGAALSLQGIVLGNIDVTQFGVGDRVNVGVGTEQKYLYIDEIEYTISGYHEETRLTFGTPQPTISAAFRNQINRDPRIHW